ncbi:hypothetical protein N9104_01765 [Pseudomonadales bacterium]|nr:hypothetical protein [Pseudomonadales bacterium]
MATYWRGNSRQEYEKYLDIARKMQAEQGLSDIQRGRLSTAQMDAWTPGGTAVEAPLAQRTLAVQDAMQVTQDRAQADRDATLAQIQADRSALTGQQAQAQAAYDPYEDIIRRELEQEQPTLDSDMLYEYARVPIEARGEQLKRQALQSRGYRPSGALQGQLGNIEGQTTGNLARSAMEAQMQGFQAALQTRNQTMNLIGMGTNVAGARAGLAGQYAGMGQNLTGMQGNVLSNTIAAVPQYTPEMFADVPMPSSGGSGVGYTVGPNYTGRVHGGFSERESNFSPAFGRPQPQQPVLPTQTARSVQQSVPTSTAPYVYPFDERVQGWEEMVKTGRMKQRGQI